MELYPLEESTAAGTSIILKTRTAKAQGYDFGSYGRGFGRGRGGIQKANPIIGTKMEERKERRGNLENLKSFI